MKRLSCVSFLRSLFFIECDCAPNISSSITKYTLGLHQQKSTTDLLFSVTLRIYGGVCVWTVKRFSDSLYLYNHRIYVILTASCFFCFVVVHNNSHNTSMTINDKFPTKRTDMMTSRQMFSFSATDKNHINNNNSNMKQWKQLQN